LGLYDRFELLELRRDDGIQTFHAREIATARPVQVHLLSRKTSENEALLSRLEHLPDSERRRIVDRGETEGLLYVVTDRLAGHPGFREWLTVKSDPAARISVLDRQFLELFDTAETADVGAPKARMEPGLAGSQTRAAATSESPGSAGGSSNEPANLRPGARANFSNEPANLKPGARASFSNEPANLKPGARANFSNEPAILAGPAAFSQVAVAPVTFSPGAVSEPEISSEPSEADTASSGTHPGKRPTANALLAIALGILAAILLLAVIIAVMAFRPR
jgi:hypothetical protein